MSDYDEFDGVEYDDPMYGIDPWGDAELLDDYWYGDESMDGDHDSCMRDIGWGLDEDYYCDGDYDDL